MVTLHKDINVFLNSISIIVYLNKWEINFYNESCLMTISQELYFFDKLGMSVFLYDPAHSLSTIADILKILMNTMKCQNTCVKQSSN
jgi:hypothetical protein